MWTASWWKILCHHPEVQKLNSPSVKLVSFQETVIDQSQNRKSRSWHQNRLLLNSPRWGKFQRRLSGVNTAVVRFEPWFIYFAYFLQNIPIINVFWLKPGNISCWTMQYELERKLHGVDVEWWKHAHQIGIKLNQNSSVLLISLQILPVPQDQLEILCTYRFNCPVHIITRIFHSCRIFLFMKWTNRVNLLAKTVTAPTDLLSKSRLEAQKFFLLIVVLFTTLQDTLTTDI